MTRTRILAALLAALALPAPALAFSVWVYSGKVIIWNTPDLNYLLDADGFSGIQDGSDNQEVIESFNEWTYVSCTNLTFTNAGTTTVTNVMSTGAPANGKNEVIWKENSWPFGGSVLGITAPAISNFLNLMEADIAFNGTIDWNTGAYPTWYSQDIRSVAIHEIGHFFGLQHVLSFNGSDPPTMAPYVDPYGKTQTLSQDDKNGVCFLYPKNPPYACSTDSQCPYILDQDSSGEDIYTGKFTCSGGQCQYNGTTIKQEFGGPCALDADCKSGLFCLPWWTGDACSQYCADPSGGTGCPSGYTCQPYDAAPAGKGACIPGTAQKNDNGEPCDYNSDCKSGICLAVQAGNPLCRASCNPSNTNPCPYGSKCLPLPGDTTGKKGGCVPLGSLPENQNGIPCKADWECQSNLCYFDSEMGSSTCQQPCSTTSPNCPAGQKCIALPGNAAGVCLQVPAQLLPEGQPCTHHLDCTTGYCAPLPGMDQKFCRNACTSTASCPAGFECIFHTDPVVGLCISKGKSLGELCSSSFDCTTRICWAPAGLPAVCLPPCLSGICPNGFDCQDGTPYGSVCVELAGTLPDGTSCTKNEQCASGVCLNGLCRHACNVLLSDCPPPDGCIPANNGPAGGCVGRGALAEGQPCTTDFQCATLLCVETPGSPRTCRTPCDPAAPACAAGLACLEPAELDGLGACAEPDEQDPPEPDDTATPEPEQNLQPGTSGGLCSTSFTPASPLTTLLLLALLAAILLCSRTRTFGK